MWFFRILKVFIKTPSLLFLARVKYLDLVRGNMRLITSGKVSLFFLGKNSRILRISSLTNFEMLRIGPNFRLLSVSRGQVEMGSNVSIRSGVLIDCIGSIFDLTRGKLVIGKNVGISDNCAFFVRGNISIGESTIFGPGVQIFSENHKTDIPDVEYRLQGCEPKDVLIGSNCWIGAGTLILPGAEIGDNCIVGAGSIIAGKYPANSKIYGSKSNVRSSF